MPSLIFKISFLILSWASLGNAKAPGLIPIGPDVLDELSNETFDILISNTNRVELDGEWPRICGETAKLKASHTNLGMSLQISVSPDCLLELEKSDEEIEALPLISFSELKIQPLLRRGELVYVDSSGLTLNAAEDLNASGTKVLELQTSLPVDSFMSGSEQTQSRSRWSETNIQYGTCAPEDYGTTDPSACAGRNGSFKLNTKLKLREGTQLQGSTQLDLDPQMGTSEADFRSRTGVQIELIQEFGR